MAGPKSEKFTLNVELMLSNSAKVQTYLEDLKTKPLNVKINLNIVEKDIDKSFNSVKTKAEKLGSDITATLQKAFDNVGRPTVIDKKINDLSSALKNIEGSAVSSAKRLDELSSEFKKINEEVSKADAKLTQTTGTNDKYLKGLQRTLTAKKEELSLKRQEIELEKTHRQEILATVKANESNLAFNKQLLAMREEALIIAKRNTPIVQQSAANSRVAVLSARELQERLANQYKGFVPLPTQPIGQKAVVLPTSSGNLSKDSQRRLAEYDAEIAALKKVGELKRAATLEQSRPNIVRDLTGKFSYRTYGGVVDNFPAKKILETFANSTTGGISQARLFEMRLERELNNRASGSVGLNTSRQGMFSASNMLARFNQKSTNEALKPILDAFRAGTPLGPTGIKRALGPASFMNPNGQSLEEFFSGPAVFKSVSQQKQEFKAASNKAIREFSADYRRNVSGLTARNVNRAVTGLPLLDQQPQEFQEKVDVLFGEKSGVKRTLLAERAAAINVPLPAITTSIQLAQAERTISLAETAQRAASRGQQRDATALERLRTRQLIKGVIPSVALPATEAQRVATAFAVQYADPLRQIAQDFQALAASGHTPLNFPGNITTTADIAEAKRAIAIAKLSRTDESKRIATVNKLNQGFDKFFGAGATPNNLQLAQTASPVDILEASRKLASINKYQSLLTIEADPKIASLIPAQVGLPNSESEYIQRKNVVENARKIIKDTDKLNEQLKKNFGPATAPLAYTATAAQIQTAKQSLPNYKYKKLEDNEKDLNINLGPINSEEEFYNRNRSYQSIQRAASLANRRGSTLGTERQLLAKANKELDQLIPEELADPKQISRIASKYRLSAAQIGKLDVKGAGQFLNAKRLANPETLIQLGFAGAFGGIPSLIGGAIGGATKGGPGGAVFGSTIVQFLKGILIDPAVEFGKEYKDAFQEAGIAFRRSILGIASVNQATSQFLGADGQPLPLSQQFALQSRRAETIQIEARKRLLPLGIAGQTESTFVQGVTSALAQRGVNANPQQIARISELLGGAIQAQRPQLLENTQLLLRDVQDVLGGGPQATRTILSQLIRPALGGVQQARSAEDIVKALEKGGLGSFVDVAKGLDNPVVVLNKLAGALDLLKTKAGDKLLDALTPSLKRFLDVLNDDKTSQLFENLGEGIGQFAGFTTDFNTKLLEVATTFKDTVIPTFSAGIATMKAFAAVLPLLALGAGAIGIKALGPLALKGLGAAGAFLGGAFPVRQLASVALGAGGAGQLLPGLIPGGLGVARLGAGIANFGLATIAEGAGATGIAAGAAGLGIGGAVGISGLLVASLPIVVPAVLAFMLASTVLSEIKDAVISAKVDETDKFFRDKGEREREKRLAQKPEALAEGSLAALGLKEEYEKFTQELIAQPETRSNDIAKQLLKIVSRNKADVGTGPSLSDVLGTDVSAEQLIKLSESSPLPLAAYFEFIKLQESKLEALGRKKIGLIPGTAFGDLELSKLDLEESGQKLTGLSNQITLAERIANQKELPNTKAIAETLKTKEKEASDALADKKRIDQKLKAIEDFQNKRQKLALLPPQSKGRFDPDSDDGGEELRFNFLDARNRVLKLKVATEGEATDTEKLVEIRNSLAESSIKATDKFNDLNQELIDLKKNTGEASNSIKTGLKESVKQLKQQKDLERALNAGKASTVERALTDKELLDRNFRETGLTSGSRQKLAFAASEKILRDFKSIKKELEAFNKSGLTGKAADSGRDDIKKRLFAAGQQLPGAIESQAANAGLRFRTERERLSRAGFTDPREFQRRTLESELSEQRAGIGQLEYLGKQGVDVSELLGKARAAANDKRAEIVQATNERFAEMSMRIKDTADAFANLRKGIEDEFASRRRLIQATGEAADRLNEFISGRRERELTPIVGQVGSIQAFKDKYGYYPAGANADSLAAATNPDYMTSLERQLDEERLQNETNRIAGMPTQEQKQEEELRANIKENSSAIFNLTDATNKLRELLQKTFGLIDRFTGADVLPQGLLEQRLQPTRRDLPYDPKGAENIVLPPLPALPEGPADPRFVRGPKGLMRRVRANNFNINGNTVPGAGEQSPFTIDGQPIPAKFPSGLKGGISGPIYDMDGNPIDPSKLNTNYTRMEGKYDTSRQFKAAAGELGSTSNPFRLGLAENHNEKELLEKGYRLTEDGEFIGPDGKALLSNIPLGKWAGLTQNFKGRYKKQPQPISLSTLKQALLSLGPPSSKQDTPPELSGLIALTNSIMGSSPEGIQEALSNPELSSASLSPMTLQGGVSTLRLLGEGSTTGMEGKLFKNLPSPIIPELSSPRKIEFSNPSVAAPRVAPRLNSTKGWTPSGYLPDSKTKDRIAVMLLDSTAFPGVVKDVKTSGVFDEVAEVHHEKQFPEIMKRLKDKYPSAEFDIYPFTHGNHGRPEGFKLEQGAGKKNEYVKYGKIEEALAGAGIGPENCSINYGECNAVTGYYNSKKGMSDTARRYAGVSYGSSAVNHLYPELLPLFKYTKSLRYGQIDRAKPTPDEKAEHINRRVSKKQRESFRLIQRFRRSSPEKYLELVKILANNPNIDISSLIKEDSPKSLLTPLKIDPIPLKGMTRFTTDLVGDLAKRYGLNREDFIADRPNIRSKGYHPELGVRDFPSSLEDARRSAGTKEMTKAEFNMMHHRMNRGTTPLDPKSKAILRALLSGEGSPNPTEIGQSALKGLIGGGAQTSAFRDRAYLSALPAYKRDLSSMIDNLGYSESNNYINNAEPTVDIGGMLVRLGEAGIKNLPELGKLGPTGNSILKYLSEKQQSLGDNAMAAASIAPTGAVAGAATRVGAKVIPFLRSLLGAKSAPMLGGALKESLKVTGKVVKPKGLSAGPMLSMAKEDAGVKIALDKIRQTLPAAAIGSGALGLSVAQEANATDPTTEFNERFKKYGIEAGKRTDAALGTLGYTVDPEVEKYTSSKMEDIMDFLKRDEEYRNPKIIDKNLSGTGPEGTIDTTGSLLLNTDFIGGSAEARAARMPYTKSEEQVRIEQAAKQGITLSSRKPYRNEGSRFDKSEREVRYAQANLMGINLTPRDPYTKSEDQIREDYRLRGEKGVDLKFNNKGLVDEDNPDIGGTAPDKSFKISSSLPNAKPIEWDLNKKKDEKPATDAETLKSIESHLSKLAEGKDFQEQMTNALRTEFS